MINGNTGRVPKAVARKSANTLAKFSFDTNRNGKATHVKHPVAIKVLSRVYEHFLRGNLQPYSVQSSEREARAFPSHRPKPDEMPMPGQCFSIAVGADLERRLAFTIQGVAPDPEDPRATPAMAARLAETRARQRLAFIMGEHGIPGGAV